jgi:hypothetical protein
MRISIFAVAALAIVVCAAPTLAADRECDAQSFASVKAQIDALPEGDMKKMATDHIVMAANSMKGGKVEDCVKQLDEAVEAMGRE